MTKARRVFYATAIGALSVMSATAGSEFSKATDRKSTPVKVEELHPFTHFALIPEGSDLSSIKFERIKMVKVATQRKSVIDERSCEEATHRDSGGSIRCQGTTLQASLPAYEVTYSYDGKPLTSDEYGRDYFTFSVYLRQDELSPAMLKILSEHTRPKSRAADLFVVTTHRDVVRSVVIDEAASTYCDGNFVDAMWMRTDRKCEDKITTKTISAPSNYITVKVDPGLQASASNSPR